MVTLPEEGGFTPAIILSKVDLPAPFLPTKPTRSRRPMNRVEVFEQRALAEVDRNVGDA